MTTATVHARPFAIPTSVGPLAGDLLLPDAPRGVVAFAHGSGSSRHSARNRRVADVLVDAGLAALLVDLLTEEEGRRDDTTAELRFDIPLIADRAVAVVDAIRRDERTAVLALGLFGASTGAAAALIAAARRPTAVSAVVSRGGRPDLAGEALAEVRAPTLFIVGGADTDVLALNRAALARMTAPLRDLVVVPGATHLFEEPGALERVAELAAAHFTRHLAMARHREWPV